MLPIAHALSLYSKWKHSGYGIYTLHTASSHAQLFIINLEPTTESKG